MIFSRIHSQNSLREKKRVLRVTRENIESVRGKLEKKVHKMDFRRPAQQFSWENFKKFSIFVNFF